MKKSEYYWLVSFIWLAAMFVKSDFSIWFIVGFCFLYMAMAKWYEWLEK